MKRNSLDSSTNQRSGLRRQQSESLELLTTNSSCRSRVRRRASRVSTMFNHSAAVTSISDFNATDLRYQKDMNFPPDKMEEWEKSHAEERAANSWTIMNSAHLREIREMREALLEVQTNNSNPQWDSIKHWWAMHYDWVTSVAQIHTMYVIPFLNTRIHYPGIIEVTRDTWLDQDLNTIHQLIASSKSSDTVHDLLSVWEAYEANVFTYITLLENIGIQLYCAYFSYEEQLVFHRQVLAPMHHKLAVGSFVHHIGVEFLAKSSDKSAMILHQWPQLSCKEDLEKIHKCYLKDVVLYLDAIKEGVPVLYKELALFSVCTEAKLEEEKSEEATTILAEFFYPFDPFDTSYQKDPKLEPTHLAEWDHCAKKSPKDAWVYIFDAIKSEVLIIQEALERVENRGRSIVEWELRLIRTCLDAHHGALSGLVNIMNDYYIPAMTERFHLPEELFRAQTSAVISLEFIQNQILKFMTAEQSKLDTLLPALLVYIEELAKYCDLMESKALVLLCSYYSPPELNKVLPRHLFKILPDHAIGCLVVHIGKDRFLQEVMVQEFLPQMEWRLTFGTVYGNYVDNIVFGLRALLFGEERFQQPPVQKVNRRSSWSTRMMSRLDLQEEECTSHASSTVVSEQKVYRRSSWSTRMLSRLDLQEEEITSHAGSSMVTEPKIKLPGLLGLVRLDESTMNRVALEAEDVTTVDNTESSTATKTIWSTLVGSLSHLELDDEVVRCDGDDSISLTSSPILSRRSSLHLKDHDSSNNSTLSALFRLDEEKASTVMNRCA